MLARGHGDPPPNGGRAAIRPPRRADPRPARRRVSERAMARERGEHALRAGASTSGPMAGRRGRSGPSALVAGDHPARVRDGASEGGRRSCGVPWPDGVGNRHLSPPVTDLSPRGTAAARDAGVASPSSLGRACHRPSPRAPWRPSFRRFPRHAHGAACEPLARSAWRWRRTWRSGAWCRSRAGSWIAHGSRIGVPPASPRSPTLRSPRSSRARAWWPRRYGASGWRGWRGAWCSRSAPPRSASTSTASTWESTPSSRSAGRGVPARPWHPGEWARRERCAGPAWDSPCFCRRWGRAGGGRGPFSGS
jgi:hypothetical protein